MSLVSCTIIIAAESLEAANKLAYVIGPDVGGASTFTDRFAYSASGEPPAEYYGTQAWVEEPYVQLMQLGDAELIYGAMLQLAAEYSREPPTMEECEAFAAGMQCFVGQDLASSVAGLGLTRLP